MAREAGRVGTSCPPNGGKRTNPVTHGDGGHEVPTLRRAVGGLRLVSVKIVHETLANESILLRTIMVGTGCPPYDLVELR